MPLQRGSLTGKPFVTALNPRMRAIARLPCGMRRRLIGHRERRQARTSAHAARAKAVQRFIGIHLNHLGALFRTLSEANGRNPFMTGNTNSVLQVLALESFI